MGEVAIKVENLGKRYRIGERLKYKALRDTLTDALCMPFRAAASLLNGHQPPPSVPSSDNHFWALQDISFEIKEGEVVGIIGRNGAGKSTLLKILSRITKPTEGRAKIHGRVGSLLEVGTGFHPELTGRENLYLNGAILGMRNKEIGRKFDEIVAFAELEKFIDTPVKHYSSGMYVRLAFAVAAHLEPEILLVDEVLAVGDAAFQKKCMGKMEDVAKQGRAILLVSHNMAAILAMCEKAFLLDAGRLIDQGPSRPVVQRYLRSAISVEAIPLDERHDRSGDGSIRVVSIKLESTDSDKIIRIGSCLKVTIGYRSENPIHYAKFLIGIYDFTGIGIFLLDSDAVGGLSYSLPREGSITCVTSPINLTPGRCYINIAVRKGGVTADYVRFAGYFDVETDNVYSSGKIPPRDWVLCVLSHRWLLNENEQS